MSELRSLHLLKALGRVRTEMYEGREHLVVPVVALMEGVIHAVNASTPEYVPSSTLGLAPYGWNGRPLVLGHPALNGRQISANDARVLESQSFGQIFNARISNKRLLMDAYVDPVKAEKIGGKDMLTKIRNGEMVEVSVGAFVTTDDVPGTYNGKPYMASWQTMAPDHLAFLPNGRGACSIEMGCGAHRAAGEAPIVYEVTEDELIVAGAQDGHPFYGNQWSKDGGGEGGNPDAAAVEDWVQSYTSKGTSAIDIWMSPERQGELHAIVKAGGKVKSVSAEVRDRDRDDAEDRTEEWQDRQVTRMEKAGFNLFDEEHNEDNHELVFVKKGTSSRGLAAGYEDCVACGGSGNKDGNPCDVCDGAGELKTAESFNQGAVDMDKKAIIKSLTECPCSGFTTADVKALEAMSDEALTLLQTRTATIKAAADKAAADIEVLEAKLKAAGECEKCGGTGKMFGKECAACGGTGELKAAAAQVTEEEFLAAHPALKTLVEDKKAQDAAQKASLIAQLKTAAAGVYTETELDAKPITELMKLAQMAKVESPDFSGRGIPIPRHASDDFTPPDAYAEGLKALRARVQ